VLLVVAVESHAGGWEERTLVVVAAVTPKLGCPLVVPGGAMGMREAAVCSWGAVVVVAEL
jgi:hypothetical protein